MRDTVTATECCGRLVQIHACVKEKGGYFEHKFLLSYDLSIHR